VVVTGVFNKLLTDKDIHFTTAIGEGAVENESIDFPKNWKSLGLQKLLIHTVWLWSDQGLDWGLKFWPDSIYKGATGNDIELLADDAIQASNQFYYIHEPVKPIPYQDKDGTSKIHIGLINNSFVSKTAGSAGKVVVGLKIESVVF
jgi:hypothetical protein